MFARFGEIAAVAFYFEAIGVLYSICFFGSFGLNFADYAEMDDLLLGSFKEPIVFVAALGAISYLVYKKSTNKSLKLDFILLATPLIVAVVMALIAHYYIVVAKRSLPFSNTGLEVKVYLAENHNFEGIEKDRIIETTGILGTSGDYFFFFDTLKEGGHPLDSTIILPKSSIIQIAWRRIRVINNVSSLRRN